MPKRLGSPFTFATALNQMREFCWQCGYTQGRNGVGMSVFEIQSDRWSCAGASRARRAWHSRWIGGTGRVPHRWVARQAVHESLAHDRFVYRLQLACAACGLTDEVTCLSAAAALASGITLEPLARQSLGLVTPRTDFVGQRGPDDGSVVLRQGIIDGSGNIIYTSPPDAMSNVHVAPELLAAAHRIKVERRNARFVAAAKAFGRGARWCLALPWRVAWWPVRQVARVVAAPVRAVARWWRWAKEEPGDRIFGAGLLVTLALAVPVAFGGILYTDIREKADSEQRCTQPRHTGVVEAVSPLVDSTKLLVRFVGGLEYRAEARAEDPVLKPGLTGYVCENGHFHYAPAPPPTATLPLPAGEDF